MLNLLQLKKGVPIMINVNIGYEIRERYTRLNQDTVLHLVYLVEVKTFETVDSGPNIRHQILLSDSAEIALNNLDVLKQECLKSADIYNVYTIDKSDVQKIMEYYKLDNSYLLELPSILRND